MNARELPEDASKELVPKQGISKDDPIFQIGKNPFHSECTDLAENHDFYLYGPVTYDPSKPKTSRKGS